VGLPHPHAPKVFIVILNWNGLEDTLECLASVAQLDYPFRQTLVVDNGSTDGSPERLRIAYPNLILIEHRANLGYTGGNNAGMRYAMTHGADYVWLLNNDAVVEPTSLSRLVTTASQDENIGLISPSIYDYSERDRVQFVGELADVARQRLIRAPDPREAQPARSSYRPVLWGTALFVRSTVIQRVGYLDDRYFAYFEDFDYSLRALDAGFRILVEPEALVYHKWAGSSGADSPFRVYLFTRNWYRFWSTQLRGIPKYRYLPRYVAWAIRQAVSFKEAGNRRAAEACFDGIWNAIRGRYGPPGHAIPMPGPIRRILYTHSYLSIWLLTGELRKILHAIGARLRSRR